MQAVSIRQTELGKAVFAEKPISKGDIIYEEDPFISCQLSWNRSYGYLACDYCLKPLETIEQNITRLSQNATIIVPYIECYQFDTSKIRSCDFCHIAYCSDACYALAYKDYHKYLCVQNRGEGVHPLHQLEEAWKNIHYPPETNTIILAVRLVCKLLSYVNRDDGIAYMKQFCHRTIYETNTGYFAVKFIAEEFADNLDLLYQLFLKAMPPQAADIITTKEQFNSLLALIGTNAQGVGTSPLSRWVSKTSELNLSADQKRELDDFITHLYNQLDESVGINFLDTEGVAIYTLHSACNHSCVPNAEVSFKYNNHRLTLTALEDIREDEQVFISYYPDCVSSRSRHTRQKYLTENYLFKCCCERCVQEEGIQDDVTSDDEDEDA